MPRAQATQTTDWRESRRLRAWALHQQGWSHRRIAEEVGVTQGAVSQWLKRVRESGSVNALRRQPAPGRRAALTNEQFAQLPRLLARGAESFGFRGDQWTTRRVATLIQQVFGVSYHPAHVSRILNQYCPGWQNREKE